AYEETRYGHGGNTEAQSAQLLVEPTKKEVYVAMSNIAGGATVVWELPAALYGNAPKPSVRTFTEEKDVTGVYLTTRHPTGSYMTFGAWLTPLFVWKKDAQTLWVHGKEIKQVANQTFERDGQVLYFEGRGEVRTLATQQASYLEWYKIHPAKAFVGYGLLAGCALGLLYWAIRLLATPILFFKGKTDRNWRLFYGQIVASVSALIILMNNVLLFVQTSNGVSGLGLLPHFLLNGAYVVFTIYLVYALVNMWRFVGRGRFLSLISVLFTVVTSGVILFFGLYH
ncbi:MAG: hypothetical protein ACRC5C_09425, partial [Bacilli bacterium]